MTASARFTYLYRDASNAKAWGSVALAGEVRPEHLIRLRAALFQSDLFVAEQVGVPALQGALVHPDVGATADDHGFHEVAAFETVRHEEATRPIAWVEAFLQRFEAVGGRWRPAASPFGR